MPKGDKYILLKHYLQNANLPEISLSFSDIETIIGASLPESALKHGEVWWSNNYDHSQAVAWMDAGYETDYVTDTFKDKRIIFVKT